VLSIPQRAIYVVYYLDGITIGIGGNQMKAGNIISISLAGSALLVGTAALTVAIIALARTKRRQH